MFTKIVAAVTAACCMAGCVNSSGIQPDGADAYHVIAVGDTGFNSSGRMQLKLYKQASSFCAGKGDVVQTISSGSQQSHPLGGFPQATLYFRCVKRDANE